MVHSGWGYCQMRIYHFQLDLAMLSTNHAFSPITFDFTLDSNQSWSRIADKVGESIATKVTFS